MELPEKFKEQMADIGLEDVLTALCDTQPGVSVRLNPLKDGMECAVANGVSVPWWPDGRILPARPDFTLDPAWHQGRYYVQESSSMFIAHVVRELMPKKPVLAVDMCAAPGGKSTAALDALWRDSFLVSNEFVPQRAEILRENLVKWGRAGVAVTCGDTAEVAAALRGMADLVIADMPCSGEGMMRKSAEARAQWSLGLVRDCAALQREIAENAWKTLAPGGVLIYSTCTFNTLENEGNIQWIIDTFGAEPVRVHIEPQWGITGAVGGSDIPVYRFLPGRTPGEGLFVAVLRKPGELVPHQVANGLKTESDAEARWSIPAGWIKVVKRLQRQKHLKLLFAGVQTGQAKGRGFIPAHPLAMSVDVKDEVTPRFEVDLPTAITYLRHEAIMTPDAPKGLIMLTYGGYPLGYANNLGSRANNLYPVHYRIRKG